MTPAALVLTTHRQHRGSTLLVDVDRALAMALAKETGVAALTRTGKRPEEMWALHGAATLKLAVLSAPRSARELFRVLVLTERLVEPGGSIFILPVTDGAVKDVRVEATEIFCGAYSNWARKLADGLVVELRKKQVVDTPLATKRVISLSLFGEDERYWRSLPTYIRAHHALFPGYELRIHHDDAIHRMPYGDVLYGLQRRGLVKLVYVPSKLHTGKCEKMLWRLLPCWDPEVVYVFCRDVDSLPTWRERLAAEEFIASDYSVGVIHDNVQHTGMMGGLCHFKANFLQEMEDDFKAFVADAGFSSDDWAEHGADQDWLNSFVLETDPMVLEHSLFKAFSENGERLYPRLAHTRFELESPSQDVIDSVSVTVRERSDSFINYMGAASYDAERANMFYDPFTPAAVREAEAFAGWQR